jgi:DnaJ-class molecular chaperone
MAARVLAVITPATPFGMILSGACTPGCGWCGGCTAPWEREADDDEDDTEVCPDCHGSGEIVREDGSDRQIAAVCLECGGKGWIQ